MQTAHAVDIYYQVWELDPYCGYTCYDWADYWGYSFISNEPPYGGPTYTAWIWYPPVASINWYAAHLNLGELSDELTIIGVDVQSVSIPNQTVSVKLEGGTASGVLTVQFLGDTTHTIYSGTKGVGIDVGETQLDHYIGTSGCNKYGGTYGTRKTIKLCCF